MSDDEITLLAHCLVEQIKLRGPFLSFSDFTNRRLVGTPVNLIPIDLASWGSKSQEVETCSWFGAERCRQPLLKHQSMILKINGSSTTSLVGSWPNNPQIPQIPNRRFDEPVEVEQHFLPPSEMNFLSSEFGLFAFAKGPRQKSRPSNPYRKILTNPNIFIILVV